jgi:hypothetical protein
MSSLPAHNPPVWAVGPSIRPGGGTLRKWADAGYKVAVMRQGEPLDFASHQVIVDRYHGWAASINRLIAEIMAFDAEAEWFVCANDDTLPDETHTPHSVSVELEQHFCRCLWRGQPYDETCMPLFGVMQPTGDLKLWPNSRIDRFAGSAWIGRSFAKRAYGGKGPLWPYPHCYADEELMQVAQKLGVFWQRPDLTHKHLHFMRGSEPKPEWWDATAGADYHNSRALFEERKAAGWPGHDPI